MIAFPPGVKVWIAGGFSAQLLTQRKRPLTALVA
jgi:hypothetical protein